MIPSVSKGNVDGKRKGTGKDALKECFVKVRKKVALIDGPLFCEQAEKITRKMGKFNLFHRWKE